MALSKKKEKNSWMTSGLDFGKTSEKEAADKTPAADATTAKEITTTDIKTSEIDNEQSVETLNISTDDKTDKQIPVKEKSSTESFTPEQTTTYKQEPAEAVLPNASKEEPKQIHQEASIENNPSLNEIPNVSSYPSYSPIKSEQLYPDSDNLSVRNSHKGGPYTYEERIQMIKEYAKENPETKQGVDYMSPMQNIVLNSGVIQKFSQTWMREPRSVKMSCSITPTLRRKLEHEIRHWNIKSMNDLVNFLLEQYFEEKEKMILMQKNETNK